MDVFEAIQTRRSIRRFTQGKVPEEAIREIIRAASLAPSINNSQPWRFIVLRERKLLRQMGEAVSAKIDELFPDAELPRRQSQKNQMDRLSTFFTQAPTVVALVMGPYEAVVDHLLDKSRIDRDQLTEIRRYPNLQSIGAAAQNFLLAAHAQGYGACWLSGMLVARAELEEILGIKAPYTLASCIALGYPADRPVEVPRKSVDLITEFR